MRIEKNGPELVLSTMTVGKARTLFGSNIAIELDHFKDYGLIVPENVVAVHGTITPSLEYLLHLPRDKRANFPGTVMRGVFFAQMHPIETTVRMLNTRATQTDLVVHPETGAYLLQKLRAGRVTLKNIRLQVENEEDDGGDGLEFARLFPNFRPQEPKGVRALADELVKFGDVRRLLDVDHFWNNYPGGSIAEAAEEMGGVDTVHISGPRHVGTSPERILQIAETVRPQRITLEGRIPPHSDSIRGRVSAEHLKNIQEHVHCLTGEELILGA